MNSLIGSAPKASFSTQPTIQPAQQFVLNTLSSMLAGPLGAGSPRSNAAYDLAGQSLAGLEQQAMGVPTGPSGQQSSTQTQAFNTLQQSLGFQAPQIDATQAFQKGVVDPLTNAFNTTILPGIEGTYGGSAGGAYGSGKMEADQQAGLNLEQTLAGSGSQFALGAAQSNQSAALQGQNLILSALGLVPSTLTAPETVTGANIGLNTALLDPYQKTLADMIAAATGQTQTTTGVGTGGSTGLLSGLLGGATSGLTSAGASGVTGLESLVTWLTASDVRVKDDVEQVGEVGGFPLYRYRYKGEPANVRRIGVMAQDVEKRLPAAVVTDRRTGVKHVDYGAVVANLLEAA